MPTNRQDANRYHRMGVWAGLAGGVQVGVLAAHQLFKALLEEMASKLVNNMASKVVDKTALLPGKLVNKSYTAIDPAKT